MHYIQTKKNTISVEELSEILVEKKPRNIIMTQSFFFQNFFWGNLPNIYCNSKDGI